MGYRAEMFSGLIDCDSVARTMTVHNRDVVFVKGVLEASEGVASMFSEGGGQLVLVAPRSRASELDVIVSDLCDELDVQATSVVQLGESSGSTE